MFGTHEVALLLVVAIPVVVLVALNIYLFFGGERGTLLLPDLNAYPTITHDPMPQAEASEFEEEPLRKAA